LLAARALADHYSKVTVLERDTFPAVGEHRRGVPQGRHSHGLLASGSKVIERWFPGISEDMVAAGALSGDIAADSRWFNENACLARFKSGLEGLLMTRPFLEGQLRQRLLALPNVQARENFHVEGLIASNGRVTGVKGSADAIESDLVIDSTGRGSHSAQWLEALGYPKPEEERVEVALAYTTRFFRRQREHLNGDKVVVVPPTPEGKRGGVMLAQEGDRWTVTLIGHHGQVAPLEVDGFVEYARTIPAPYIHEVIQHAEPLGEATSARFPHSLRRRYEKLDRFPEGYLVFGDAISSFNPIYGQGMSVAALESIELAASLAEGSDGLARRFFQRAAKVVDMPWAISVGNDLRLPETVGPRNAGVNFINWYMSKLHRAAHTDPVTALAFFQVANLLAPPPSILKPNVAWRVLVGNMKARPKPVQRAAAAGA
jgi:2-polyprenyl-6-methoxyphenol hydroxylase-like FAD-dependent oxidoreductase